MASLRKPPPPKSVDDFVASGSEVGVPAASDATSEKRVTAKSTPSEEASDGKKASERRRTTVYFEKEVFRRLNVYCANHDLEMSEVVGKAVEAWVEKNGG